MENKLESIYQRYTTALDRMTGKGIGMDAGAVRLAMQLAIADAQAAGREEGYCHAAVINQDYCAQLDRLAEYMIKHGHASDELFDLAPEAVVSRAIGTIVNLVQANSKLDSGQQLAAWLVVNLDVAVDGNTPIEQASNALTYYHDLVTAQQAVIAQLHDEKHMIREQRQQQAEQIQAMSTEITSLRANLAKLQQSERAALARADEIQEAMTATTPMASPNGNGHVAGIDWSGLSPNAADFRLGLERGAHQWRKLPLYIRLELVQCVLRQGDGGTLKQKDFDAIRPSWMPSASGLPLQFAASWADLPILSDVAVANG